MARALRKYLRTPLAPFGLIVVLIYLNQVLFTVYVIRVHRGECLVGSVRSALNG